MRGKLEIDIRRDAMAVTVCVVPEGRTEITEQLLREQIAAKGVKTGIREEALKEIAEHGVLGQSYLVAEGIPAVDGKSGYYEDRKSVV